MSYRSQREQVLDALRLAAGQWVPITHFVFDLGITRFGARIWELRREGYQIESHEEHVGRTRHVSYRIVPKEQRETL